MLILNRYQLSRVSTAIYDLAVGTSEAEQKQGKRELNIDTYFSLEYPITAMLLNFVF